MEVAPKQTEPAGPIVLGARVLYKDAGEWSVVLKKYYQNLATLLEKKDWGGIAELYGPDVVVNWAEGGTHFKGGHDIAFHFWQKMYEKKHWNKVIGFEIEVTKIFPVDIPVRIRGVFDRFNQLVFFRGKFTTEASPASSILFDGAAGHIQSCSDWLLSESF